MMEQDESGIGMSNELFSVTRIAAGRSASWRARGSTRPNRRATSAREGTHAVMPHFETFNRNLPSVKGPPRITLLRSGMLSLNKPAYLTLESPEAVELLYDCDEQIIGVREVEPRAETAYIVRGPARGCSGPFLVTALAFTKFYEIDTTDSLRWEAHLNGDVLCIRLTDECTPVTSNRARNKRSVGSSVVPMRRAGPAAPAPGHSGLTGAG